MDKATIVVAYVNQPKAGKKKGSVKGTDGVMYGVWPDKLGLFQVGGTYEITYSISNFNGAQYKNVESVKQTAAPSAQAAGGTGGGGGGGPHDEHIHVSLILKEAIRANLLDPNNEDAVVELGLKARSAHKRIWSAAAAPKQPNDDMEDSIPF